MFKNKTENEIMKGYRILVEAAIFEVTSGRWFLLEILDKSLEQRELQEVCPGCLHEPPEADYDKVWLFYKVCFIEVSLVCTLFYK